MEGNKKKILIVDDDGFLLDMYAFKFSQNNFEVYTFMEGEAVLAKLKEGINPDIILMDITMPGMDGFEVLENINNNNLSPNSIKIILSNKSQQADIDRGNKLGVAGYIIKANSTPTEVINEVAEILEKNSLLKKDK
ncbi:MAG: two-component system, OmpR family, response regulator [Patescibacteria group bacterium]|nr:two-component system, OmpR family, response regulator [Patescibacteria group bacterium]